MTEELHSGNEFLKKVISVIEEHLGDENFEVPDLAGELNMSRSSLLRKVKSLTGLSVSVFIRKVRLYHAREFLKEDDVTVSEVCYKTGFNSPSYFTKCFREEFGYTPGEQKNLPADPEPDQPIIRKADHRKWLVPLIILAIVAVAGYLLFDRFSINNEYTLPEEKSIAVLPFANDSGDTSNVYLVNGLMQTILSNLQQIRELKVTSRTTVEKYRDSGLSIPEISKELEVNYFVEGSGQKSGDQILLSIQLIDGRNDRQIWSKQYAEKTGDIFKLQAEVAQNIAEEIQVVISPEVNERITKKPTENLEAYDLYLKGRNAISRETREGLLEGIRYFKAAISEDPEFAHPYAYLSVSYFYLEIFQAEKQYAEEINTNADKALLLDPDLPESLIAKGLFYAQDAQYELAIEYFEKVLTINPNSTWVHNLLSDIYTNYRPDTRKYLVHALQGIRAVTAGQDSVGISISYLHLSNALAQSGFISEADKYVKKSLDYNPDNLFSGYLQVYIQLAMNFNLEEASRKLKILLEKDTTRLDIIQEIAKVSYTMEDYEDAWEYYESFIKIQQDLNLNIFPGEDIKIAWVLSRLGKDDQAEFFYEKYRNFAENDPSIYHELNLAAYYAALDQTEQGMEHFRKFSDESAIQYWVVLFLDKDPIIRNLSSHPDYKETLKRITDNFWDEHHKRREMLENDGIL